MKNCPKCQTNYADNTYDFCLECGEPLVESSDSQSPTVFLTDEQQTQVKIKPTEQVQFYPPTEAQDWQSSQVTQISPQFPPIPQSPPQFPPIPQLPPQPQKSNTVQAVLLTALGMFALFGAGFGAWFFLGNRQTEVAQNKNISSPNSKNSNNSTRSPSPKPSANSNANVAQPTVSPTPEIDSEKIKSEVSGEINDWKSATESGDINSVMSHYADSINFYGSQKSKSAVRNDKQNAFNKFDTMDISLSNMSVTPDASGERATAVFDKEWVFSGEKVYAGKVQSQFQLVKSGGRWLITSEKDLKVYYVKK